MMENSFEKQISDKLKNTQVQPSEHLLDSIFEKRAAKVKRFAVYPFTAALVGVVVIAILGIWAWGGSSGKNEDMSEYANKAQIQETMDAKQNTASSGSGANLGSELTPLSGDAIAQSNKAEDIRKKSQARKNKPNAVFVNSQPNKTEKNQGFAKPVQNANGIENQYFNLGNGERPLIQKTEHQGNSHLYVYQTIGEDALLNRDFLFTRVARMRKLMVNMNIEALEMVENQPAKRNGPEKSKKPIYVDFLINPSMSIANVNGEKTMVEASKSVLKPSFNQGVGLRISIPVSRQWNVFSGLYYKEQTVRYNGKIYYISPLTQINQHIKYINDPLKGVIKVVTYDTVNTQVANSQSVNFKNQYKVVQLPIGLSYNFAFKAFEFAINGSALVNYIRSTQGQSIDLDQHKTSSYSTEKGMLGLGAGLSFMGAYKINNRIKLIAEPGLQYFGMKSLHFGNNVNEKVLSPQLTIGLRYTLF